MMSWVKQSGSYGSDIEISSSLVPIAHWLLLGFVVAEAIGLGVFIWWLCT